MERKVPPGYEPYGAQGIKLIDPPCPGGHDIQWGQRTWSPCAEHRGHPGWSCACGVEQWLLVVDGEATYVTDLPCREPNYGQQRDQSAASAGSE